MKLTYITPSSRVINLEPMQMLAVSGPKVGIVEDESQSADPSGAFSAGKDWNSDSWSSDED